MHYGILKKEIRNSKYGSNYFEPPRPCRGRGFSDFNIMG